MWTSPPPRTPPDQPASRRRTARAVVTHRHAVIVRHAVAIVVAVAPACSASRRVSGPTPREMSEACAAAPPLPPSPESAQREPKRLWPDLDAGQSDPNEQAQREPLLPVAMSSSSPVTPSPSSSSSLGCDLHISNFACGCVEPRGVVRVTWQRASVICSAAKIALRAYFVEADWPLNKALPRGAEFACGPLGDIVRQYCLEKSQVARQLLNYKKGRYLNTQVSILLNQSDLDERIREGMAMSTPRFVSSTLLRICDPEPSSYGSDFSNLCVVMSSLQSTARTYVWLLASCPDDACFCLLVGVVENWIQGMAEKFPKTAAEVSNAQLNFERVKGLKMRTFLADFMKDYNTTGLPSFSGYMWHHFRAVGCISPSCSFSCMVRCNMRQREAAH